MKLIRRDFRWPFDIFDDWFNFDFSVSDFRMKTDIKENDNEYEFSIDLPGMSKDEIKIAYEDGYLVVSASREKVVEDDNQKYLRRERSYGEYSRRFYLGEIDDTKISAKYEDGVLKIVIPKDEIEKAKAKKYITIN